MSLPILYVATKNYSSWSMRPWLALTWAEIPFEERLIELGPRDAPGGNPEIHAVSPAGTVPVLHLPEGAVIWDSLAICEWAAEEAPDAGLWPQDRLARAHARAVTAEMHAGFAALRRELPMNIRRRTPPRTPSPETAAQVRRVEAIWTECLSRSGGHTFLGRGQVWRMRSTRP